MRFILYQFGLMVLVVAGCSTKTDTKETNGSLFDEKSLYEKVDDKERKVKTVVTGRIPGEDIYLTIRQFDTLGRVVAEYGAKPYGDKFRSIFKYDAQGRLMEEEIYDFPGTQAFEHYGEHAFYSLYSLSDTMANFETVRSKSRILYVYNDEK